MRTRYGISVRQTNTCQKPGQERRQCSNPLPAPPSTSPTAWHAHTCYRGRLRADSLRVACDVHGSYASYIDYPLRKRHAFVCSIISLVFTIISRGSMLDTLQPHQPNPREQLSILLEEPLRFPRMMAANLRGFQGAYLRETVVGRLAGFRQFAGDFEGRFVCFKRFLRVALRISVKA